MLTLPAAMSADNCMMPLRWLVRSPAGSSMRRDGFAECADLLVDGVTEGMNDRGRREPTATTPVPAGGFEFGGNLVRRILRSLSVRIGKAGDARDAEISSDGAGEGIDASRIERADDYPRLSR